MTNSWDLVNQRDEEYLRIVVNLWWTTIKKTAMTNNSNLSLTTLKNSWNLSWIMKNCSSTFTNNKNLWKKTTNIIKIFSMNIWLVVKAEWNKKYFRRDMKLTCWRFNNPGTICSPAGTYTDVLDVDLFVISPAQERWYFVLSANWDVTVLPSDPETSELIWVQNTCKQTNEYINNSTTINNFPTNVNEIKFLTWCWYFSNFRLGSVFPDDGFAVSPSPDEDLIHGVDLGGGSGQSDVGIVGGSDSELNEPCVVREKVVFKFVFSFKFWKRKINLVSLGKWKT